MQVLKVAQFECLRTALPNSNRPSKVQSTFLHKQFFVQSFFSTSVIFYVLNYLELDVRTPILMNRNSYFIIELFNLLLSYFYLSSFSLVVFVL